MPVYDDLNEWRQSPRVERIDALNDNMKAAIVATRREHHDCAQKIVNSRLAGRFAARDSASHPDMLKLREFRARIADSEAELAILKEMRNADNAKGAR